MNTLYVYFDNKHDLLLVICNPDKCGFVWSDVRPTISFTNIITVIILLFHQMSQRFFFIFIVFSYKRVRTD